MNDMAQINDKSRRQICYTKQAELPFELPTPFYYAMFAIWQLSPPLQRQFPLQFKRERDYLNFLAWCAVRGYTQYRSLRELSCWREALRCPISLPRLDGDPFGGGFSVGMFLTALVRARFNVSLVLWSSRYRRRFSEWYWGRVHEGHDFSQLHGWQRVWINDSFGGLQEFGASLGVDINIGVSDFQAGSEQSFAFKQGWLPRFMSLIPAKPYGFLRRIFSRYRKVADSYEICSLFSLAEPAHSSLECKAKFSSPFPMGINLYGYAHGELGIGEDVRMLASAFKEVGIPFCVINIQPGAGVSQKDDSVVQWLAEEPRYSVNVFCMTGIENLRYYLIHGYGVFSGRYNVGLWPWELPEWPKQWSHVYSLIDEIWGISKYTALAYTGSNVPVNVMPLPVSIGSKSMLGREDFGLPENCYLYYFSFDFNSTLARKNPEALVSAFFEAFPKHSDLNVGLVLKVSHLRKRHAAWSRLKKLIDSDSRIFIVEESLRRPDLLALYDCCDCLVSLHRAEGFGRVIAEAILLGKQVVTTSFSGNMDYCDEERVALVTSGSVAVGDGEYFFSGGQWWADPDVDDAAQKMHDVLMSPRAVSGCHLIDNYSPAEAGKVYKNWFETLIAS